MAVMIWSTSIGLIPPVTATAILRNCKVCTGQAGSMMFANLLILGFLADPSRWTAPSIIAQLCLLAGLILLLPGEDDRKEGYAVRRDNRRLRHDCVQGR